jgi:hypothetical protein
MESPVSENRGITWSAPGLAVRSALVGLAIFMGAAVALVPLANRKLAGVFWVGAAVNLVLFCGVSLAAPVVLMRRVGEQVGTPLRRVACVLAYALGWLAAPCAGLMLFVGATSRIVLAQWHVPLLSGMTVAFGLLALATGLRQSVRPSSPTLDSAAKIPLP